MRENVVQKLSKNGCTNTDHFQDFPKSLALPQEITYVLILLIKTRRLTNTNEDVNSLNKQTRA